MSQIRSISVGVCAERRTNGRLLPRRRSLLTQCAAEWAMPRQVDQLLAWYEEVYEDWQRQQTSQHCLLSSRVSLPRSATPRIACS